MGKFITLMLMTAIAFTACKKKDQPAAKSSQVNAPQTYNPDTSHNGNYRMIYCSVAAELDTNLYLRCSYDHYYIDSSFDVNNAYLYYKVTDGKSPMYYCFISKTVQWHPNQGTPNQAYIVMYKNAFTSAFVQDTRVTYSYGGKFSGDTLILPVTINPTGGSSYSMLCKYKR